MKIYRSQVTPKLGLRVDEALGDIPCEALGHSYPLLGLKNTSIKGIFEKNGDFLTFNGVISGTAIYADARTSEPFEKELSVKEVIDLLEDENEEGDGYIFPGNAIELEEIVLAVLRSETPIKPLKPGSSEPEGEGTYEYFLEQEEPKKSSPFDVLLDLDLD